MVFPVPEAMGLGPTEATRGAALRTPALIREACETALHEVRHGTTLGEHREALADPPAHVSLCHRLDVLQLSRGERHHS